MRYLGGKSRICKELAAEINYLMFPDQVYYEPFCGACWISQHVQAKTRILSDTHQDLILLWKSLQRGNVMPTEISEEIYQVLKDDEPSALRGFVGFGSSYGGKWFGGFARAIKTERNYAKESSISLLNKMVNLLDATFLHADYTELIIPPGSFIYCDPPYKGTTGYKGTNAFDHDEFWDWCRQRANENSIILVSEYTAPDDVLEYKSWTVTADLDSASTDSKGQRVEKLFLVNNINA